MLGDVPRLRIICGDRRGDFVNIVPFSLSGEGELPPPDAELRRDDPIRTSKWRKRNVTSFFESSVLLNRNANGHEIQEDSLENILKLIKKARKLPKRKFLLRRWLYRDGRPIASRWRHFHGDPRRARLVDGRIVNLRVADHPHEERALLGERVLLARIFRDLHEVVVLLLLQQLRREVGDDVPRVFDVVVGGVLCDGAEANGVALVHRRRHHVELAAAVDDAQKLLIQLARSFQAKANQAQLDLVAHLEALVLQHQLLELLRQADVVPDVLLQAGDAVGAQHEPQLERAEATRQWNSPVPVVDGGVGVAVLQIKRIDDQCGRQADAITHPQRGAVEVRQQPFIGIRVEGVCVLDALNEADVSGSASPFCVAHLQQRLQLRADERVASVRCIDVQPDVGELLQRLPDLFQRVERATPGGAERGRHEERNQSLQLVFLHRLRSLFGIEIV